MITCDFCGKKMPNHILDKHLAKSHSDKLEAVGIPTVGIPDVQAPVEVTSTPEPKKWYESWDAGEIGTCAQCHQEWPSRLMGFHLKLEHGL